MSSRGKLILWSLIGVGVVVRTIVAFETYGFIYDMDSIHQVRAALGDDALNVYTTVNGDPYNRWPYPSGFFPFISGTGQLSDWTGLKFHGMVQLAPIAADAAIAWFVQDHLGRRGLGERMRLAAAGLVALGPSFGIISGWHGQIDSVAMLPAVVALWYWERSTPGMRRALVAGALIGIGVSIKTIPALMVLALLPSVRSPREAAALIVPAVAVPFVLLLPWLVADFDGFVEAYRSHRALTGFGGISLLVQPGLADAWLSQDKLELSALTEFISEKEMPLTILLMAPFIGLVLLRRPEPTTAAVLLFSALPLLSIGFAFQYVLWALPLVLMAGYVWQAAALQAAMLFPTIVFELTPWDPPPSGLYVAFMIGVWVVSMWAVIKLALRLHRERPAPRRAEPLPSPT